MQLDDSLAGLEVAEAWLRLKLVEQSIDEIRLFLGSDKVHGVLRNVLGPIHELHCCASFCSDYVPPLLQKKRVTYYSLG